MIGAWMALVLGAAEAQPEYSQGAAIGRLVTAVKGDKPYEDSDFVKPLGSGDKQALAILSNCSFSNFTPAYKGGPEYNGKFVPDPGRFILTWKCRGLASADGQQLMLVFDGEKISRVRAFDLDKVKQP